MLSTMIQKLLAGSSVSNYAALAAIGQKIVQGETTAIYVWKHQEFNRVYATYSPKPVPFYPKLYENILKGHKIRLSSLYTVDKKFLCIPLGYDSTDVGIIVKQVRSPKKNISEKESEALKIYRFMACFALQQIELKKELSLAKKAQESMVNNTAHNLRTPLTSLAVYIRLFRKKERDKQKLMWLQRITLASQRLARVADELAKATVRDAQKS